MLTKKTATGIGVGAFVIAIGSFFLIQSFVSSAIAVNDTVDIGKPDIFQFQAQKHFHELLNISGSSFHVTLTAPSNGSQVNQDYEKQTSFDWYSPADGKYFINVTNTGDSAVHVTGAIEAVQDPIVFATHLIVISSGILIIGFSAAFSIRRPRGF